VISQEIHQLSSSKDPEIREQFRARKGYMDVKKERE